MAEKVDRIGFIDLLNRMLTMEQDMRITPSEAPNHPFVTMAHMMEICKRSTAVVTPSSHTAATLMAAGVRSGNITLTFDNQRGGRVGTTVAQVGLVVRECTATYDAHSQVASAAQLVPGALLPVPPIPPLPPPTAGGWWPWGVQQASSSMSQSQRWNR